MRLSHYGSITEMVPSTVSSSAHTKHSSSCCDFVQKVMPYYANLEITALASLFHRELFLNINMLRKVAHQILGKFRKSFADVINDELIGDGSATLLQQLESRKENLQRMTMPRKRPKSSTADRDQPPRKNSKMELDSFGCIKTQWNPELPVGESQDTQEEKKKFLQNEYDKLYWSVDNVSKLMTATYSSQRHGINDKKNIEDLLKEWPFLAEEKWLFEHFHRLTEIDLTERLNDAFEKKGSRLLMYLKTKNAPLTLRLLDFSVCNLKTCYSKDNVQQC